MGRREPDKKKYKKSDLVTTKPQQQSIQIHMTYINPKRPIVSSMEVNWTRKHIIHCKPILIIENPKKEK